MTLYKYHGLGNDFIITCEEEHLDYSQLAKKLCNRHTGIGADGLIVIPKDIYKFIIYNADGSIAQMCGNGIRCYAMYLYEVLKIKTLEYDVETLDGVKHLSITNLKPFTVKVKMGKSTTKINHTIINYDQDYEVYYLNFGVPHAIIYVKDYHFDLNKVGSYICNHPTFINKTNVNFVKVIDKDHLMVKTYERGCGLTLACGTGSTSSVIVSNYLQQVSSTCEVILPLGSLKITLGDEVYMEGPAERICKITL